MPTIAELSNVNSQQVQDLLDMAKASEAAKAASSLQEEAQAGQEMLAKIKESSESPAEYANKRAKALAKSAKAAMGEAGEGVISLPSGRAAAAAERAARAAAGSVGEGVIPMSGQTPSFLQRIASLAEGSGAAVLEKLGVSKEALGALASKTSPALKTGVKAMLSTPASVALGVLDPTEAAASSEFPHGAGSKKVITGMDDYKDEATFKAPPIQRASSPFDSVEQIRRDAQNQPLNPSYVKALADLKEKRAEYFEYLKKDETMPSETKAGHWNAFLANNSDEALHQRALEKAAEIDSDKAELKTQISDVQQRISEAQNPFARDDLTKRLAQLNSRLRSYEPGFGGSDASRMVAAPSSPMPPEPPEVEQVLSQTPSGQPAPTPASATVGAPSILKPKARTSSAGEPTAAQVTKEARQEELTKFLGEQAAKQIAEQESLLARFKDAQERERLAQLGVGLAQAAERMGSAIAMVKPGDQTPYEQAMKLAGGITDDFKEEVAMADEAEKRDPKSAISKTYQDFFKSMGVAITGNESAEVLMKVLPFVQQYQSQKENREARMVQQQIQRETLAANKAILMDEKAQKDLIKMSEKLNAEIASSRTAFGKGANIIRSAEALETLVSQMNPRDINTRQIQELARGLDAMLSQGAATISGTKKLVPESYSADLAKIIEYISSKPKGAGQEAFVKQMMETVAREKETAKRQMLKTQNKILSGYGHLKEKYPERYNQILTEYGIPTETSKEEVSLSQKNPKVQEYANLHFGGDYNKAVQFLESRRKKE
jgi:hypothetical protein